jgi:DNA end-binding protein Ku
MSNRSFPATSERAQTSFHRLNKDTSNRIRYRKVDAETGDEVDSDKIIKGCEVAEGSFLRADSQVIRACFTQPASCRLLAQSSQIDPRT